MRSVSASGGAKWLGASTGQLVLNDDGQVFLYMSDDLQPADLRRYLETYCRPGVGAVAYCVGDMSWPTFYPSRVGQPLEQVADPPGDLLRARVRSNLANFAAEPGGYFGAVFSLLSELGKPALASFRMNDAHHGGSDDASAFWQQHAHLALGEAYGYYGCCLNYAYETVRAHFLDLVTEFLELYPQVAGIELDALREPFFFPPTEGRENAPLFTQLVRSIREALTQQARRQGRPDYLLSANVPLRPELALDCGLDVAAWDAEGLVDLVSVGAYPATMNHPLEQWRQTCSQGTRVFAYINCSPQTGQYLGVREYRAAAANAYGSGADGVYLFNYPCLFELAGQVPGPVEEVSMELPDLRAWGQLDLEGVEAVLDELGAADQLHGRSKRFLFYFCDTGGYRHHDPDSATLQRREPAACSATFRCYEECEGAESVTLRFKLQDVVRTERFSVRINGCEVPPERQWVQYAPNGRDTRMHTVPLGPYLQYELALTAAELRRGENVLQVTPTRLQDAGETVIRLVEVELQIEY